MKHEAITLRHLRALSALARLGSITAAAEALSLTPPAVHNQLKMLASAIGAPVTRRNASGRLELTEVARVLVRAATRIDAELARAAEEVRAVAAGRAGMVRLGVVSTGKYFAPRLVAALGRRAPGVDVRLVIGNRDEIVNHIRDGALDLVIMGRPPRQPAMWSRILGPHPFGIIAAPDHPLAGSVAVPEALLQEVFLTREAGSGTRALTTRYLDALGEGRIVEVLEMGSNETIKQAVMAGLGIALISLHTVADELAAGRLARIDAPALPIVRHWYLLQPAGEEPEPVTAAVREGIMASAADCLPRVATAPASG